MLKVVVKVEGMKCPHCSAHVKECIEKGFKTKSVEVSHESGEAVVLCESIDKDALADAIKQDGYNVTDVTAEEVAKKGFFASIFKK